MITDNTCKECGKEKCGQKTGDTCHFTKCHGHSEEKKEPQPKVCEGCQDNHSVCQDSKTAPCHIPRDNHWHTWVPCPDCRPPLPPKDGKGEDGWEEDYKKLVAGHLPSITNPSLMMVNIYAWQKIVPFIRQEKAASRLKAIEDAMEAVKCGCGSTDGRVHTSICKGELVQRSGVLSALDKLKKV